MDWTIVEETRDRIKEFSEIMFQNFMTGMEEAGIDITNPIEMMVVLKKMDPTKFEQLFHPSIVQDGKSRVEPMLPAALWSLSENMALDIIKRFEGTEYEQKLKGKRVCVVSGDLHYFGLYVMSRVLVGLGADVLYGGNSMDAVDVLDMADEYGIKNIGVSLHNGQALPYAKLLDQLAKERNKEYNFYLGGVLTSFLHEDDEKPSDVTANIEELGLHTTKSVDELVEALAMQAE